MDGLRSDGGEPDFLGRGIVIIPIVTRRSIC